MAAPVMSDDSKPLPEEVEHLGIPVIAAQGPAMMEDDGLRVLGAPVLVEDRHAILRGNRAHSSLLSFDAQAPTSHSRSTSNAWAALRPIPHAADRPARPEFPCLLDRRACRRRGCVFDFGCVSART